MNSDDVTTPADPCSEKLRDAVIAAGLADLAASEAMHRLNVEPVSRDIVQALEMDTRRSYLRAAMLLTSIAHVEALRALRAAFEKAGTS